MRLFLFLDESGNLLGSQERYFVLVAFVTRDPRATRKCFLKARHARLPRKFRRYAEIKFSDRIIPDRFKLYALKQLLQTDLRIYALVLDKHKMPAHLKRLPAGMVYRRLVIQLLDLAPIEQFRAVHVFMDRRQMKKERRSLFNAELEDYALSKMNEIRFQINHVDSTTNVNVQIADFLAGAVFQKYERNDLRYYAQIAEKIIAENVLSTD